MKKILFFFLFLFLFKTKIVESKYLIQTDNIDINPNQQQLLTTQIEVVVKTSNKPFVFSISEDLLDFGVITPTDPVARLNHLFISKPEDLSYSIQLFEDQMLKEDKTKEIIPDTTCDNGACSPITSALWENTLTYGFGYSFPVAGYFKQLPNKAKNAAMETIIHGLYGRKKERMEILYKINIPGAQKPGVYHNNITYIAVPNY